MNYAIVSEDGSATCLDDHLAAGASAPADADIIIYCNVPHLVDPGKVAVLIELGRECLGVHTGEADGHEGSNVVGFARYRNGAEPPSSLIEIVRQPQTTKSAIEAACALFEGVGLTVAVCGDEPGRIVDRLVRPKYNAALRFLDEGLADREAIDKTCRLGLGYPLGPIERVIAGGLGDHFAVTRALHEATGLAGYVPARRSAVAHARGEC